jgi:glyoxylase-like metal-dependent hydrolase (beta-lactamase superfamily II)
MDLIRITAVNGNAQKLDGGSMYGNAPRSVWEKWSPPDALGRIELACRAMLVEIGATKVLCETGIGAFFEPKLAERYGVESPETHLLLKELKGLGLSDSSIDYVVLSHLHFDHAGGLFPPYIEHIKDKSQLLFPNAKYIVGREAWQRALKPHSRDRASFIPELIEALKNSGRLLIVDSADDLPPALKPHFEFYISNGHTPGQMLSIVKGKNHRVVFTGDLVPGSPWVHLPITMGYDRFPEKLIDEKQELYQTLTEKNDILFFTHDPKMAAASFYKDEKGKYLIENSYIDLRAFEI